MRIKDTKKKPLKQSNMNQTAIQQLINIMENSPSLENGFEWKRVAKLFLEIEKEQIIESYCQGCWDMMTDNGISPRETSEEYYNKIFKSK